MVNTVPCCLPVPRLPSLILLLPPRHGLWLSWGLGGSGGPWPAQPDAGRALRKIDPRGVNLQFPEFPPGGAEVAGVFSDKPWPPRARGHHTLQSDLWKGRRPRDREGYVELEGWGEAFFKSLKHLSKNAVGLWCLVPQCCYVDSLLGLSSLYQYRPPIHCFLGEVSVRTGGWQAREELR